MRRFFEAALPTCFLVCFLVVVGYGVRSANREYCRSAFGREVGEYDRTTERQVAFVQFKLAEPLLTENEVEEYRRRLQTEASEDDRRYALAIASLFDQESFDRTCEDSFDLIGTDLMQRFLNEREASPGKEIFELWDAQNKVGHYAWYYAVEGLHDFDGTVCEVTYDQYVKWKPEWRAKKEKLEALLASNKK